jgi:phage terminase small subunit
MATEAHGNREGRPRKPTALRVLHGDKMPPREPVPHSAVTGEIAKPAMSPGAQAEWDRIAPEMIRLGVLTEWDVGLFVEWCELLILLRAARVRAAQELTGKLVIAPGAPTALASYSRALVNSMALAGRFGLTPADRARLMTPLDARRGGVADLLD